MKYCVVVPMATDRYEFFYSGFSGTIETVKARTRACVFDKLGEAKEAARDINRSLKRDGKLVDPRMQCYVAEWVAMETAKEKADRAEGIFPGRES